MRYKKNKRPPTPLGELFDKADFPFEPAAWSQMETLLSEAPAHKKAGINGTKRIIGLLILGIMFIGGSMFMLKENKLMVINQSPFSAETEKIVQTNFTENPKDSPLPNAQAGSVFEAKKGFFELEKDKNITSNPIVNSTYKSLSYTPKSSYANSSFMGKKINNSTFKNTMLSKQNIEVKAQNEYKLLENSQNDNQFYASNNIKSFSEKTEKDSLLNTLITKSNYQVDNALAPQYFEQNLAQKTDVGLTIEDVYAPEKRMYYATIDALATPELTREINSEFSFDFAPYGWALDEMKAIQRPLWQGKKHEFYFGIGIVNLKSFNIKYARRITPIMGLGAFYYQAQDNFASYIDFSNLGIETQFYLVNRRHFECVLSISYAHEWGSLTYQPVHPEFKSDFAFGAGLELRYCLNQNWNLGFRLDTKKQLANLLLQLGYRF
jgi:hypothetical protein